MNKLENSIKKRYLLFISTILVIIVVGLLVTQSSVNKQKNIALLIEKTLKQGMLSEGISRLVLPQRESINDTINSDTLKSLKVLVDDLQNSHTKLYTNNINNNNETLDSLLQVSDVYLNTIVKSSKNVISIPNKQLVQQDIKAITETEAPYFLTLHKVVMEYQKVSSENIEQFKRTVYVLTVIAMLILLGEFLFILAPAIRQLFEQNNELITANKNLSESRNKIKANLVELTELKKDFEIKEVYNKAFIEQASIAIAMLDTNMCFIAVSHCWIKDYKMEGKEIIGASYYDLFPEVGDDWKARHQKCLSGAIDTCEEAPFLCADGSVKWIYCDTRPWYIYDGNIGGLLMHTSDITHIKEKEEERLHIETILNRSNEVARIGTWEVDMLKGELFWSKMVCEIHEVPVDFKPDIETAINFYKEGESRDAISKAVEEVIEFGTSFDIEVEIVTAKGNTVWVRSIGQAEFVEGNCVRLFGVFQDINIIKRSQLALAKAHMELKAIFNSNAVAIVATELNGVISQFNHGAEILTGYSAEEVIGLHRPTLFHLQDELDKFRIDIANQYGKDPTGFSAQEELAKHNAYDTREWHYLRKDKTTLPIQLTLTSIKDEKGYLIGFLGIATDISEKILVQDDLLRKNKLLNFAEEISLMGNWQSDFINNVVKFSDNLYTILGLEKESEIDFNTYISFVHQEDKEKVSKHRENTIESKKFNDLIHRIVLADGTIKIVQLRAIVITDFLGDIIEIFGTCQDVTAQKTIETELIRKNHFLSFAERITKMGNWQWDTVSDTLKWSSNLYKIYEYDENITDLNYDTFFSQVHPDDKAFITEYVQNAFNEKKFPNNFIHRIVTQSGKIKTVHYLGEIILNEQGEVIEMMGTCQDITEQKMEENKFRGLLESAPDAMVIVDENDKIQLINKEAENLFGYSVEELVGESVEILIPERFIAMHNEHRNSFFTKDQKRKISTARKELYALNKEHQEIPIQVSISPLKTEQGLLLSAAIRDITAQKQAENEILRKNQLLNFAEKITMMGNWQWDLITNTVEWSANLYNIFGVEENKAITYETYFGFVHVDDKNKVTQHVERAIKDKKFIDLMHRITLKDGTVKTIQLLAEVIVDGLGNVVEMIGTCQDVTAQRMAENKFRGLLESAPDAMVIVNAEGNIQLINKQAEKLFGYTADELINKAVELLIPKQFLESHESHREGFFSNPKVRNMGVGNNKELFAKNKNGLEIPIQISLSPLETEEGLLVSAAIRDITIQKRAQTKIINAKNELEVLAQKLIIQNSQLADFAQITSHNLRAPVSNLNSLLGFYLESDDIEEKEILVKKFEAVINHLTLTLNTLVKALKIRSDNSRVKEDILFEDVLMRTTDILSGEILETNAIIKSDFSKLSLINYDKIYLESIFLNLIGNAIKYRSKDRDPVINITSYNDNGKIKLIISDNGLGINLDRHGDKIFGLNKVFHRHPDAKGVGLYMTKTQIEAMGGAINVSSKVNKGTTFTITF